MNVNLQVEIFLKSRVAGIVLIVNRWNAEPTKFGHNKSKYIHKCRPESRRQGLTLQMVSHQKCNLAASSERQRNNYILKFSFHFHKIQFRNKSCTFFTAFKCQAWLFVLLFNTFSWYRCIISSIKPKLSHKNWRTKLLKTNIKHASISLKITCKRKEMSTYRIEEQLVKIVCQAWHLNAVERNCSFLVQALFAFYNIS